MTISYSPLFPQIIHQNSLLLEYIWESIISFSNTPHPPSKTFVLPPIWLCSPSNTSSLSSSHQYFLTFTPTPLSKSSGKPKTTFRNYDPERWGRDALEWFLFRRQIRHQGRGLVRVDLRCVRYAVKRNRSVCIPRRVPTYMLRSSPVSLNKSSSRIPLVPASSRNSTNFFTATTWYAVSIGMVCISLFECSGEITDIVCRCIMDLHM